MTRRTLGAIVRLALLVAVVAPALGSAQGRHHRRSIPEFDPAAAGAIAALVAGGGVLLARRKRR